jgi:hypothetical protein
MIMDKISNSEDENVALHNVEGYVLDRLLTQHDSGSNPSIDIGELNKSTDDAISPLLDQAIEDLVSQGLVRSLDGENYQITQDGINELKNRKKDPIPL